ncbi:MAG: hypothetical protein GWO24_26125, partial [Akkermansiaceae bacterium]|nr:hypothetical protein [Akkermansiaceae bacterium]
MTADRIRYGVGAGLGLTFGLLETLTNSTITIPAGTTVVAPALSGFSGSILNLDGSGQFNAASLSDVDAARFLLTG